MNKRTQMFLFLIFILGAISSCSSDQPKISNKLETSFQKIIGIKETNNYFRVEVDPAKNEDLKFGSDIHIVIENLSDQQIIFRVDLGVRLFIVRG